MECNHARLLIALTPPHGSELEASEAAALEQHLAECSECGTFAHTERQVDERLGQAMRDVSVPAGLRARIVKKLESQHALSRKRYLVRTMAIAAGLLLAVGLGAWWLIPGKQDVDWAALWVNEPVLSAEGVEKFFRDHGVTMVAPPESKFKYQNLDDCGLAAFQGVQVPHLLFVARDFVKDDKSGQMIEMPRELAHVYVLSSRHFDLKKAYNNPIGQPSGHYSVAVDLPPAPFKERFLFVIVYTGQDRERFGPDPPKRPAAN